ncbi:MAG: endonuclease/exonuclease/phosphatase family protein [Bacteroidota bacterium]
MKNYFLLTTLLLAFFNSAQAQDLRVMSYNIRYNNPNDGPNAWPERKDYLINQVLFSEASILGIQEGLLDQVQYIDQAIPNFAYVGVGRDDGKTAGEFSAIFYDKRKYKVLSSGTFWLSPTPEEPSKGWDAALPRVCTYARLKAKGGNKFWIFNTHFDHRGKVARVESTKVILEQIKRLNTKQEHVILMGDFNLPPESEAIQNLSKQLNDTYDVSELPPLGPAGTFNSFSWAQAIERRIDYIFVSSDVKVKHMAILTDSKDQRYPSDHFPVLAKLRL